MPLFRSNVRPLFKITNIIYNQFLNFTIHILKLVDDSKVLDKPEFTQYNNFLIACVWVVQVMNHINPEYINHHNYKVLCDYGDTYDHWEEKACHSLIEKEKYGIKERTIEGKNNNSINNTDSKCCIL
jgi:hypothetical protein